MSDVITKAVEGSNVIAPAIHDGELRILDTDLAARLGFDRPRNIRNLIKRYGADLDKMGPRFTVERVINGGTATETYLNKKQAIFITAKSETAEATEIKIEIIEKFDAYEQGKVHHSVFKAPTNMREALMLALDQQEEIERQKALIDEAAPKVAVHDRIYRAFGSLNITEAAKALQLGPKFLFMWLFTNEWTYRRAGGKSWLGYQKRIAAGYLEHKVTPLSQQDGTEKLSEQVRITAKGLTRLASIIPGANLDPDLMPSDPKGPSPVPFAKTPEPVS